MADQFKTPNAMENSGLPTGQWGLLMSQHGRGSRVGRGAFGTGDDWAAYEDLGGLRRTMGSANYATGVANPFSSGSGITRIQGFGSGGTSDDPGKHNWQTLGKASRFSGEAVRYGMDDRYRAKINKNINWMSGNPQRSSTTTPRTPTLPSPSPSTGSSSLSRSNPSWVFRTRVGRRVGAKVGNMALRGLDRLEKRFPSLGGGTRNDNDPFDLGPDPF
jgi:hypothetical protein